MCCVHIAGGLSPGDGYESHCCKVLGIEVAEVACCHLFPDYGVVAGNRRCDSSEESFPYSTFSVGTLLVWHAVFLPNIRIDLSVFEVVRIVSAAPVVVSLDLVGGALALGVVLVALVTECLLSFPGSALSIVIVMLVAGLGVWVFGGKKW